MASLSLKVAALGSAVIGGYLAGSHFERRQIIEQLHDNFKSDKEIFEHILIPQRSFKFKMPLLPGTVSAATPIAADANILSGPARVSQIMKYGFPGLDHVRSYDDYVLSYDRRNRVPHWVIEHLTKQNVKANDGVDRAKCDFSPDESIHGFFRSDNSDYKGSGFDRGHMAAAGNHRLAQRHVDQTFFLSNISPQVGKGFNRHAWNKLEKHVRKLTNVYENVYCCTGPLYLPKKEADGKNYIRYQVIGKNTVAVPTHFYKVIVGETSTGQVDLECYCMPNESIPDETPTNAFQVPPESIEKAAGLLFFEKIPRNKFLKINGKKQ